MEFFRLYDWLIYICVVLVPNQYCMDRMKARFLLSLVDKDIVHRLRVLCKNYTDRHLLFSLARKGYIGKYTCLRASIFPGSQLPITDRGVHRLAIKGNTFLNY